MLYNLPLLEQLYLIHSPSRREARMSEFVQKTLHELGVSHDVDAHGQIYSFRYPGRPLLSAHMDQVQIRPCTQVLQKAKGSIWESDTGLGADDKNGIWIVLELLKRFSALNSDFAATGPNLNFVFSVEEECMGTALEELLAVPENAEFLKASVPYGLVFDRKGWGDIIGADNCYCVEEMEKDLEAISQRLGFGYRACAGVYSDADRLNAHISCVNLSCGYFSAHSEDEYTLIPALENALEFAATIIENCDKKYPAPEFRRPKRRSWLPVGLCKYVPAGTGAQFFPDDDPAEYDLGLDPAETDDPFCYCPDCYQGIDLESAVIDAIGHLRCDICGTTSPLEEILGEGYMPLDEDEIKFVREMVQDFSEPDTGTAPIPFNNAL